MTITYASESRPRARQSVPCGCCGGRYCHGGEEPGICGQPIPAAARCRWAAAWVARLVYECGMFHDHDEVVELCTHCIDDLRRCEERDGTVRVVWVLPLDGGHAEGGDQ